MTQLIQFAADIAREKHASQKRKYDGAPYFTHVERVARITSAQGGSENQIAAAYLHDVLEDTPTTEGQLLNELKSRGATGTDAAIIVSLVVQLTDTFTKENYPNLNRAARKKLEAARLGRISSEAMNIKLADLIDNTADIVSADAGFAKKYLAEKKEILSWFEGKTNPVLFEMARSQTAVLNKVREILE